MPVRLAVLVTGTTLPLIAFAAALVYQYYQQDQKEAFNRVQQFTRSVQLVVDREMQGILSGLTVLASSPALADDNFEEFRKLAAAFLTRFPDSPSIVIGDRSGQIVFNSSEPAGVALPKRTERPGRDAVFRTGLPVFSPVFIGALSKKPIVTVSVPVYRDGSVVYDLSFNPPQATFQRIIDQQKPSDDWTIAIFDRDGVNFARVPNPSRTVAKKASPSLLAVMFSAPQGTARTVSLEGVPLMTAFSRSGLTGWITAAGIAERTLTAPAVRTFMLTAAIGAVMLAIGLGFAVRMATQIARAEQLHSLLIDELNHRVKNTLATVQSLSAQTFRSGAGPEERSKFAARLHSLGRTHDILSAKKWEGASIRDVVTATLTPFEGTKPDRISISGPDLLMPSRAVVMLSMVLHELATNAAKYGALSDTDGRVLIDWRQIVEADEPWIEMYWRETGGPPVRKPERSGFGSTLIEKGFAAQLGGTADLRYEPDGVTCTLQFPLHAKAA